MTDRNKDNLFFIVDIGKLEAQAILLATSLHKHNEGCFNIYAYVPRDSLDGLSPITREVLSLAEIELVTFDVPPETWKKPYPHGNKILAARLHRAGRWSAFLDTDLICTKQLDLTQIKRSNAVSVAPEGTPTWGYGTDRWQRVYDHFDLAFPSETIRMARRKRVEFVPYFNAGFVLFEDGVLKKPDKGFGDLWLDTAREIDFNCPVALKRPWLDQISLPVTLKRFGLEYNICPDEFNYAISARAYIPEFKPYFMHYHDFKWLSSWPSALEVFDWLKELFGDQAASMAISEFSHFYEQIDSQTQ